jgi:Zn-dependent peptidase ImmA (M78 family)/DNA-binding XRE family transcriptional regulator
MNDHVPTARGNQPRIVPERIREAREAGGYSVETFADLLGVTRQAVGQYETGKISPSAEAMSKIIGLTKQPPAFFTTERSARDYGTPFWRSLKRMKTQDRLRIARRMAWATDIVNYVERFMELPPVKLPSFDWDWETGDEVALERIATVTRDFWALGRGPIFHMSKVLESNGLIIVKEPVYCEDMDAVSRWQGGRPYILMSAEKDHLPRNNFDLAHELGHLLLHNGVDVNTDNIDKLEKQANYFAGAFLLPREMFAREVVSTSVHYFFKLKERWRVSVAAMIYRCKALGILSKSQVSYLFRQLTAKNMRNPEPLDTAFKPEAPSLIRAALSMLIEAGVQSRAEIVSELCLNQEDIELLSGTEKGFLGETVIQLKFKPRTVA